MRKLLICSLMPFLFAGCTTTQDRFIYVEKQDEYASRLEGEAPSTGKMRMVVDLSGRTVPESPAEFKQIWHQKPVCQDLTGTCWSFSATSMFESEVHRLTGKQVKLSEMYTVYWEYVEKARRFIQQKGDSAFGRGSQFNAAPRIWKKYGIVPADAYSGRLVDQTYFNDQPVYNEMKECLDSIKQAGQWDESEGLARIKAVLSKHMGEPPVAITVAGTVMTPQRYLTEHLKLNMDDYVDLMSLANKPFCEYCEYEVWDNWWHADSYLNLPLDEFIGVLQKAAQHGYSVCLGGDTSEPGCRPHCDVAVVPTFDLESSAINDAARLMRFENETTSDDHAIVMVGHTTKSGKNWYLIKDSETKAQNGHHNGYMFYDEDYIKLKMMNMMVHKDMVPQ